MKESWDATGQLEKLWKELDPPTADTLASIAGVHVKTIYSANSGNKPLGIVAGRKLAEATGRTIQDIGAPDPVNDVFATSLLGRIVQELESNPPAGTSRRLLALADSLRDVADRLEAVAAGQDAEELHG